MAVLHKENYQSMQDDLSKWAGMSNDFLEQSRMHVDAAERCYNAYLQVRRGMFAMDPIAPSPIEDSINAPKPEMATSVRR
jgi:hypothetical protein